MCFWYIPCNDFPSGICSFGYHNTSRLYTKRSFLDPMIIFCTANVCQIGHFTGQSVQTVWHCLNIIQLMQKVRYEIILSSEFLPTSIIELYNEISSYLEWYRASRPYYLKNKCLFIYSIYIAYVTCYQYMYKNFFYQGKI